jgi:peptidoglycan/xylan/chitin deacetylase (PgdA/CDA1 family)
MAILDRRSRVTLTRPRISGRRAAKAAVTALVAGVPAYWVSVSSQSQLLGAFPNKSPVARPGRTRTIALTFDDGPNEPYTSRLAEILRQRDVRATFFQVGRAVARHPDTSRALLSAGHVIGNHSYSHELRRCFTARFIDDEISRAQDVFGDVLQIRPLLYRPPWLVRTPATFRILHRYRLQPVSGTFCHLLEVAQPSAQRMALSAVARSRPDGMIIFHDGYNGREANRAQTLDAVARTIDALAERGWSFATVDELLGVAPYGVGSTDSFYSPATRGTEA